VAGELQDKRERIERRLSELGRVIVAFSAGVDSTVVLKMALETLGTGKVLAATGVSPSLANRELDSVRDLAARLGAPLRLIETYEMDNPAYTANSPDRCYHCKSELYTKLLELATKEGFDAIVNGINSDDQGDWRPGIAAANEFKVVAPLLEAGVTKAEGRELAERLRLPNWDKPALACLSSRIPYGTPVTITSLGQIERAEAFLYDKGLRGFRVRHHGKVARIEVAPADLPRICADPLRTEVVAQFKEAGYVYVTVDLQGYRSGSGNEVLKKQGT
jgi:pyridinium-3,5-biscarboxylic acid mononucleotide sulfurtransferase